MKFLSLSEENKIKKFMDEHNILERAKMLQEEWERISDKKIEDITMLYHYTSIEGLKGILDSSSLWFTDGKFLNDSTEFIHGIEKIRKCAIDIKNKNNDTINKKDIDNFFDTKVDLLIEKIGKKIENTFVLSASVNNDLLMLWSNYAKYAGYNIGIDFKKLKQMMYGTNIGNGNYDEKIKYSSFDGDIKNYGNFIVDYCGIIYDEKIQEKIICYDLEAFYKEICTNYYDKLDSIMISGVYKNENLKFVIDETVETMAASLSLIILFLKNKGFYPEEEFRISITDLKGEYVKEFLKFRSRDERSIPYLEVVFKANSTRKILPIGSITTGPTNMDFISEEGLLEYLKHSEYDLVDKIYKSQITLRY